MADGPRDFREKDVTLPNSLALQMENPAGLAQALIGFAAQAGTG